MNDVLKYGALAAGAYFLYQQFQRPAAQQLPGQQQPVPQQQTPQQPTAQQPTPQQQTPQQPAPQPKVGAPAEPELRRAAASAAYVAEAGAAMLNWHEWNFYRRAYSPTLATPAPEDVGMGDGNQRITAQQYHDALKAAGLAGLTLGILRRG